MLSTIFRPMLFNKPRAAHLVLCHTWRRSSQVRHSRTSASRNWGEGIQMESRCDTGRIVPILIPDGGSEVPTAVAAPPVLDRSKVVRPDHAATRCSSDPGNRRRPAGRRAEHSTLQRAAYPPRRLGRPCWPVALGLLLLASCSPAGISGPAGADRRGAAAAADQLDGDHAGRRGPGDRGDAGVRLVVPGVQPACRPRSRSGL